MNKLFQYIFLILISGFLVVVSIASLNDMSMGNSASDKVVQEKLNNVSEGGVMVTMDNGVTKVITDINTLPLQDNLDIYMNDDPGSVVIMYLTVRRGNDQDETNHSWQEVNNVTKFFFEKNEQVVVPQAEAILQVGDENGPVPGEFGYDNQLPNATVQIRGGSTSMMPQKSYKIEIFDSAGDWRGQKTINLNKHIFDPTRSRNKLAFDLMKGMPNMVSLRTQFVHLFVKDETATPPETAFTDYGLFTQIEQPNRRFLKNHLLDRYGQLYKATMFEFFRYPDKIRLADDPLYDEEAFASILEIKGNRDHTKLIAMLDAVNNPAIPIERTFETYFDAENFFTWMAFNILVSNVDTTAQNFYLYSPQNGQKFYFLPWDYDDTFNRKTKSDYFSYEYGISSYWGSVLYRRVLEVPKYRTRLDEKVQELLETLTPARLNELANINRLVTDQYVSVMPDVYYFPVTQKEYDEIYSDIPDDPYLNYALYKESLQSPMPFFLGVPELHGNMHRFHWDEAFDFDAQDIIYTFEVSTHWDFDTTVYQAHMTNVNTIEIPELPSGTYFWRVIATNEDGFEAVPFDYYNDSEGSLHDGLKYMYVTPSGEILESESE